MKHTTPTYFNRNILLVQLGYNSYKDYLSSELWAEIRDAVLDRDGKKCRVCANTARVVHHIDYTEQTLRGDSIDTLVSLCHSCHDKIEFTTKGEKRTLTEAVEFYYELMPGMRARAGVLVGKRNKCDGCNNTAKKGKKKCRICVKKARRCPTKKRAKSKLNKCVSCTNWAKKHSVMCRPCLKKARKSKGA